MTNAKTPNGKSVKVEITAEYGTYRLQAGRIYFGGIAVSGWNEGGSGCQSITAALANADKEIEKCGLEEEE